MDELIQTIDMLLGKIAQKAASKESLEWYLQNNLKDYKAALQAKPSALEIRNATRSLVRFCTESMDWDDSLYQECCAITEKGMHLAKQQEPLGSD